MRTITAALCGVSLLIAIPALAQEDCREVGPTHPDYPNYNAIRCFVTIPARLLEVSVLEGTRTVRVLEESGHLIPHPCEAPERDEVDETDEVGAGTVFTVNNDAVWDMITDGYHHRPNRTARLTFDIRRNLIRELEDGNIDTHYTPMPRHSRRLVPCGRELRRKARAPALSLPTPPSQRS